MALTPQSSKTTRGRPEDHPGVLPVYSVTPFTMLDFPERTACIIWFSGCNMRCPYCHNPQIVKGRGRGDIGQVMDFLQRRQGLLDGVVLSGGEASAYPRLPSFIRDVKALGYAVKLDTNGLRPDIIEDFLSQGFLDYIALDYKAPPEKFKTVTGTDKYDLFSRTLEILCSQKAVEFEVRTTVHTSLIDENDITKIMADLEKRGYEGFYVLQNFINSDDRPTLGLMPPQKRILDRAAIKQHQPFRLTFRNFPG
ncbi:MAG: anaerobic ribonucleoside-triphosphate reductase activating protein [Alphaproteobacteria bacterium]|nr:anaerobic ribonucleoside-triphosphate reductase activating protein [Alphaproteobacteria bacterium]QQS57957.1 MAG: anaerobic ribonucleoside-triphosphate reductase activating protein [Alphaproteobacteria bacterium]